MVQDIVIPLSGTFRPKGGMTSSVLKKASVLADAGHRVTLVTFRFRLDQKEHEKSLVEQQLISPRVAIVNFFETLDNSVSGDLEKRDSAELGVSRPRHLLQRQHSKLTRHFNPLGDLLYTELTNSNETPYILRRYYDLQLELVRIDELDQHGVLRRIRRFIPGIAKALSETFMARSGCAYLTLWYRPDGSVRSVIDLSKDQAELSPEYDRIGRFQARWFKEIVSSNSETVLLIDDPHSFDITQHALPLARKRVLTLHSNTFNTPDDVTSGTNIENHALLGKITEFDHVIASTEAQCEDLRAEFPNKTFTAIPQSVNAPDRDQMSKIYRDKNLIVYVGRLEASKQLIELINSLPPVFKKYPTLQFEIYGEGSLEVEISTLINYLGLEHCVKLMGRTENPMEVFAAANLSVLPTKFEGFGMTIAESMLAGTPVVAFDCRYGPSDMIEDGITGKLVEPQRFVEFVDALAQLLADQSAIDSMRLKAAEKIERLCSPSNNRELWNAVVRQ